MKYFRSLVKLFLFIPFFVVSQNLLETTPPNHIKTIQFHGNTPQSQLPILKLGESFKISFDDLHASEEDYYYTIQHYSFDWTPSDLSKSEYLDGFDDVRIENYQNSFNTLQIYSHYELRIPNRDVRGITKSGNYLLRVFNERGVLQFSKVFMVYEEAANVGVSIKRTRDLKFIDTKQVVQFTVNPLNFNFINPNQNVKTLILQNSNLTNSISHLKPQYTMGNELIYRYDLEASFYGGNEYLNFDNSDVRGINTGVRRVAMEKLYINYLYTNISRKDRSYTYNPDINGNFVVRNIRGTNSDNDAEYVWMHFALQYYDDLKDGEEIHVFGNFNNYALNETTLMKYDAENAVYRNEILLKQGFYNYDYVLKDKNGSVDRGGVSGNFDETENDYTVLVYYRELGGRYDRIIGIGGNNSQNISNN